MYFGSGSWKNRFRVILSRLYVVQVSAPSPPIAFAMKPRGWKSSGLVFLVYSGVASHVPLVPPWLNIRGVTTMCQKFSVAV